MGFPPVQIPHFDPFQKCLSIPTSSHVFVFFIETMLLFTVSYTCCCKMKISSDDGSGIRLGHWFETLSLNWIASTVSYPLFHIVGLPGKNAGLFYNSCIHNFPVDIHEPIKEILIWCNIICQFFLLWDISKVFYILLLFSLFVVMYLFWINVFICFSMRI